MFAVLAEDRSDADALAVLIKRIVCSDNLQVRKKGFSGCGELCRKAWSHIVDFASQGATHFIICHDSDGNDPAEIKAKVKRDIEAKLDLRSYIYKIIIPVQELEAWIIADEAAIKATIPSLSIDPVAWPERIESPKEWLIRKSQMGKSKPLYAPATWNARVAKHLDISKVEKKCGSFAEFATFVRDKK